MVRLGLIGVGRWGRNYVKTLASADGVVLAAVASRNPETASIIPPGTRLTSEWRDLLVEGGIDGVIVATPPDSHAEIVEAALALGLPCMVEKPLVASRAALAELTAAAKASAAAILVDHIHLFHPAFRRLKHLCAGRRIVRIRSSAGNHGPYRSDTTVLWDWGPHDIAMALDLVPGHIHVLGAKVEETQMIGAVCAERIGLRLELEGGIPCDISIGTLADKHRWFAVETDDGAMIYADQPPFLRLVPSLPDEIGPLLDREVGEQIAVAAGMPLSVAVSEFADLVRQGSGDRSSFQLAGQVVAVIAECEEILQNG